MRLFGKKPSTSVPPSTSAGAEEEAAEEIRRAAEALQLSMPADAGSAGWAPAPAGPEPRPAEAVEEHVAAPHEADPPWEEAEAVSEGTEAGLADLLPEDARPVRRRVRKTPPRPAGAAPPPARSSSPTSSPGRR
ncbi:MAG: hypothetical protein ACR2MO_00585 [Acidimicrobiales bacterium]